MVWPKIAHRAVARRGQPDQAPQGRGLAGAVAAKQGDDLALAHFEADAVQDVALAVEGVEAFGDQRRPLMRLSPDRPPARASFAAISCGVPSASIAALGQHHDAVGEVEDDPHVVLDQHDRELWSWCSRRISRVML